jgi:CHAD domain-containing protein
VSNLHNRPDESYCFFGAKALLERLRAFECEIDGVTKAEDIECIHRMRVASRRLRSAFRLFGECFDQKDIEHWQKQTKQITKSLGSARDIDVQIDFLREFIKELDDKRHIPGIKRLLFRLQQKREKIQSKVISSMIQLSDSGIIEQIAESCHIMSNIARLHQKDEHSISVYENAYIQISLNLEKFLSYKEYINQPDKTDELHAMRISAKRFRYTMEIFSPLYKDNLEKPIEAIKKIQTILGDFNDCVVWVNYLSQFIEEEYYRTLNYFGHTKSFSRLKTGILYLQENRRKKQAEYYNSFVRYWSEISEKEVLNRLIKSISDYVIKKG